ncbi:MAG: helix-turn-helix domain-containing protein [Mariprofundaceae bacterium]|nr:helix-turn-helix domain-containing protein [Mariprofundaceae bacterium]
MKAEILHISQPEQARSELIRLYIDGHIKPKEAAKRMGLSVRQVRRLRQPTDPKP